MTANNPGALSLSALKSQRLSFIFATLAGAALIILSRYFGLGGAYGALVSSSLAGLCMLVYLAYCLKQGALFRPSTLGDNLYYLGFLYTLVSLLWTLISYSENVEITSIIQNFGIAITTTLLGLLLRVAFNQERDDPELYEYAVRMSLTDAAASTIGQIDKIRADVTTLRTAISQTINEGVQQSISKLSDELQAYSVRLDRHLGDLFLELQSSLKSVTGELGSEFSVRHRELQSATKEAISELQSNLGESSKVQSRLSQESSRFLTKLSRLNDEIEGLEPIDQKLIASLSSPVVDLRENLLNLAVEIRNSVGSIGGVRSEIDNVSQEYSRLSSTFHDGIISRVNALESDLDRVVNGVSRLGEVLDQLGRNLAGVSAATPALLKDSAEKMTIIADSVKATADGATAAIKALEKSLLELSQVNRNPIADDGRSDGPKV